MSPESPVVEAPAVAGPQDSTLIYVPQLVTVSAARKDLDHLAAPYAAAGECCILTRTGTRGAEHRLYAANGTYAAIKERMQSGTSVRPTAGRSPELEEFLAGFYPGTDFNGWVDGMVAAGVCKLPRDYTKMAESLNICSRMDDYLRAQHRGVSFDVWMHLAKLEGHKRPQDYPILAEALGLEAIMYFPQRDPEAASRVSSTKNPDTLVFPAYSNAGQIIPGAWMFYAPKGSVEATGMRNYLGRAAKRRLFE